MCGNVSDTFLWSLVFRKEENTSAGTVAKVTIRNRTGNRVPYFIPDR